MALLSTLPELTTGPNAVALTLPSDVIPAHSPKGRIRATVERHHPELRLRNGHHEIVGVDDDSTDSTWQNFLICVATHQH